MEVNKIDEYTMEFIKPVTVVYPSVTFTRDYLEAQKVTIIDAISQYIVERHRELDEINDFLALMDTAGVKCTPATVEDVVEPVIPVEDTINEPTIDIINTPIETIEPSSTNEEKPTESVIEDIPTIVKE